MAVTDRDQWTVLHSCWKKDKNQFTITFKETSYTLGFASGMDSCLQPS